MTCRASIRQRTAAVGLGYIHEAYTIRSKNHKSSVSIGKSRSTNMKPFKSNRRRMWLITNRPQKFIFIYLGLLTHADQFKRYSLFAITCLFKCRLGLI